MYPQGVCRIRKSACAGNGCAIFPAFDAEEKAKKIRSSAADGLFRVSPSRRGENRYCTEGEAPNVLLKGVPNVIQPNQSDQ